MPVFLGTESVDRFLLPAGYGCAFVLLVLYFVFESGPCHWSRRREGAYLATVLGLLYAVPLLWSTGKYASDEFDGVLKVQQLMRLVLLFRLIQSFVIPHAHPRFFDLGPTRNTVRPGLVAAAGKAQRKASHISQLVEEIAGLVTHLPDEEDGPSWAEQSLEPVLFCMLMLEDLMWAYKDIGRLLNYPLLILLVICPLIGLRHAALRYAALRRLGRKVHILVADVVDRKAEDVLQLMLASVSMGTFVELLPWETVRQVTERALELGLLCTASKAILVDALQMKGLRHNREAQHSVRGLILSCRGQELTTLKHLIDGSGSYHNLYKLVYHDITSLEIRQDVLRHFASEAAKLCGQRRGEAVGVKVLSDIDDTLHSSGGRFPAGCDKRFPKHAVYPGFLSLLRVLDRDFTAEAPSCNVVFLSARPHLYKDVSEDRSYERFRALVSEGRMHSFPTLLPGGLRDSLGSALRAVWSGSRGWRRVGERKFRDYIRYRELYREFDFAFFGDNGQGDLLAGQLMLQEDVKRKASEPRLLCVLIHRVQPDNRALRLPIRLQEEEKLIIHDGYVGAALALHALDRDLVSLSQVGEISKAAIEEFDALRWADLQGAECWAEAEAILTRQLQQVDVVLRSEGQERLPTLRRTASLRTLRLQSIWSMTSVFSRDHEGVPGDSQTIRTSGTSTARTSGTSTHSGPTVEEDEDDTPSKGPLKGDIECGPGCGEACLSPRPLRASRAQVYCTRTLPVVAGYEGTAWQACPSFRVADWVCNEPTGPGRPPIATCLSWCGRSGGSPIV